MFTSIDKALVALVMAVLSILTFFGITVPEWASEQAVGSVIGALTPVLVYFWPNWAPA
jgi:hypothetical protein